MRKRTKIAGIIVGIFAVITIVGISYESSTRLNMNTDETKTSEDRAGKGIQDEITPKNTQPITKETPTSKTTEIPIPKTNSQSEFLEGFQDAYKINDTIKFTLVFKDGQKCSTVELSLIDTKNSEFVKGIGIDDWCHSPFLSEDLTISIPYPGESPPFKTDKIGSYKIIITKDGKFVIEKEFVVKKAD